MSDNSVDSQIDLKFFPTDAGRGRGCVIVCPGGAYAGHSDHEGPCIARWLNKIGLNAFVLYYRVAPNRHPAPLEDISRAVRLVRSRADEFNIRADRVGVIGFSAGGHLAASLGVHFEEGRPDAADPLLRISSRPDAVICCYSVVSMLNFTHAGSVKNLLGDNPPRELLEKMSIEMQVRAETPPMFIWHTAEDAGVPVENSLMLGSALSRAKVPFEMHVFPHGRHGFGLGDGSSPLGASEQIAQWTRQCEVWLKSLGFFQVES